MATLTGKTPAQTYKDLLQVSNSNAGIDSTLRTIEDGEGTTSSAKISTNKFQVRPATNGTDTFEVVNSSGSVLFRIDTTNNKVVLNSGVKIEGDGSALTGIVSTGTGGSSATGNLEVQADSDASGSGDIIFKIGTKEVARIPYSYASSLPTGIAGNYFLKTVSDNFAPPLPAYILDGTDDYLSIADATSNGNLDFGTGDFDLPLFIYLDDFTPSSEKLLIEKHASNLGWKVFLTTTGAIKVQIGNGTDFTTYSYTSSALGLTDATWNLIELSFNRDGNLTVFANRVQKETIDISGSSAQTVSSTGNLVIFGNGSSYTAGRVNLINPFNRTRTLAEHISLWNNGQPHLYQLPYADRGASQTELVTNGSFDAGDTSWVKGTGWTIADQGGGDFEAVATSAPNGALFYQPDVMIVGKKYRATYTITNYTAGALVATGGVAKSSAGTFSHEFTATTSTFVFTANGTTTLRIDDISVVQIGNVLELKSENAGLIGWLDSSGNELHAQTSGSPIASHRAGRPSLVQDTKLTMTTGEYTLTNIVPKGYKIKSIYFENTTANAITGGIKIGTATTGTQVVNAQAVGANAEGLCTLASDFFSSSADQTLFVGVVTAWNSASLNLIFTFERVIG